MAPRTVGTSTPDDTQAQESLRAVSLSFHFRFQTKTLESRRVSSAALLFGGIFPVHLIVAFTLSEVAFVGTA